jgi:hypothetical protein
MLICNVSVGRAARAIATGLAEAAISTDTPIGHVGVRAAELTEQVTATDTADIEHVVFDTLVDDPASANEILDASLGSLMEEAASASDTITTGIAYAAAVDEAVTAGSAEDATVIAAAVGRSAMLPGVFVNPSTSREANVIGIMVNL